MKILVLSNKVPYPPRDGGALATLNLIKGLSQLGHSIHLLTMSTSKHPSTTVDIPEESKEIASFQIIPVRTQINPFKLLWNLFFSRLPYNIERFYSISFKNELEKILRNEEFQVIQMEGLSLALYLPFIRRISPAIIVMRAHNVEFRIWELNSIQAKPGFRKLYFNILAKRLKDFEKKSLKNCDAIVPISHNDEQTFRELGLKKPSYVAPFGSNQSCTEEELNFSGDPTIFFLGSLDWIPNQQGLIWFLDKVWEPLRLSKPDLIFRVAGRNAPDSIRKILDRKGVSFLGEVSDARDFIISNTVMIVPLFSGSGMRVKIIEAMALGRPVITTKIGAEGIGGQTGKHFIIADDPDQFCNEIKQIITKPEILSQIGRNAREFINGNFDNLVISKNLSGFYNSLVT